MVMMLLSRWDGTGCVPQSIAHRNEVANNKDIAVHQTPRNHPDHAQEVAKGYGHATLWDGQHGCGMLSSLLASSTISCMVHEPSVPILGVRLVLRYRW